MRELEKKQKIRRNIYSIPVLMVLFVVALLSLKGAYNMLLKALGTDREAKALVLEFEELESKKKRLESESERLQTQAGIEGEIKAKFNVARPGEEVALIVEAEEEESTTTEEEVSWWEEFWGGIISR